MKHHLLLILFLVCVFSRAQTTQIPDQGFEQALIDLNIDSDQTINGQVLTSDVASVTSLNLEYQGNYMQNIDGIEDFTSLKILNLSEVGLMYYGSPLDLSSLQLLEEINFGGHGDVGPNYIGEVILTENPNLKEINGAPAVIKLKGSDLNNLNLTGSLGTTFMDGTNFYVCLEVTDAQQASNQQGNYSNWQIYGYFNYSENCALNIDNSTLSKIKLYPNPTSAYFVIENQEELSFDQLSVYDFSGRLIKQFSKQENYSLQDLPTGVYFVKIDKRSKAFKIVKD